MKRATVFVLVFALLSALMTLGTFAEETWTNAELTFYSSSGTAEDPADSDGDWIPFPHWKGVGDTPIYDCHGSGMYVTATVSCSKFKVIFGNGNSDCHTNVLIYVDDELKETFVLKDKNGGGAVVTTDEISVTPGTHTIKVLAGEPKEDGWNGMCINLIQYVAAEASGENENPNPSTFDYSLSVTLICTGIAASALAIGAKKRKSNT